MRAPAASKRYRFGLFEAHPASGELLRRGVRVRLQDLPFRMLLLLLERPNEVVSREELREKLWSSDTYVEFDGSLKAALKRLRAALGDTAENPIFIETLPKRGYRFVAPVAIDDEPTAAEKAEEKEPETKVAAELYPPIHHPKVAPVKRRTSQRVRLIFAGIAAVVSVIGLGWYEVHHFARPAPHSLTMSARPVPIRKSVAILGFHNASARPQDEWLTTAMSEMLSTELASGEMLRVVSAEEVANLRLSSPWSQTSTLGRETTARIGTALNSDVLVLGSYTAIGVADHEQVRFDLRLQNVQTGEVLTHITRTGSVNNLFQFASDIGSQLRQQLGIPEIRNAEQAGVLASPPLDRDGARLYALGIAKLRDFDALAAKDLLEQATKADPKFPLAHLMLSRAWAQLGYEQKRKLEAKKALDLSVDLPRIERLQVEGDYYGSLQDREKAESTYRALFELFPDNVDYGLQLAAAQKAAGHHGEAKQTIAQLRRLPAPASDDPRIDLEDEPIPNDIPAGLALERTAMRKAEVQGKKLLYARAEKRVCMDLNYSGHLDQVDSTCEDAYQLFLAAGNRLEAADTVRLLADAQATQGHSAQAISNYQRALKILQDLGENEKTGAILNNMADAFSEQGSLDHAEDLYRQAKFHFEQAGDKPNAAISMAGIASMLYARGMLSAAEKRYRQVIDIDAELNQSSSVYYPDYQLADLKLTEGQVQEAHKLAQQAVDGIRGTHGDYQDLSAAINVLGDVLRTEGNLEAARAQYQTALDFGTKAGAPLQVAEVQVRTSELALDQGRTDQAEPLLRAAIAEFEKEKANPDNAHAYIELSRLLLMKGKVEDARKALQHAAYLSRTSGNPALKSIVAIHSARLVLAAIRQSEPEHWSLAAVHQQLRSIIDNARKLGYCGQEYEARLTLGELEMKANPELGRSLLTHLAAEAHQHGLELIASKAMALAANGTAVATARSLTH